MRPRPEADAQLPVATLKSPGAARCRLAELERRRAGGEGFARAGTRGPRLSRRSEHPGGFPSRRAQPCGSCGHNPNLTLPCRRARGAPRPGRAFVI